jgi:hypothetical protein
VQWAIDAVTSTAAEHPQSVVGSLPPAFRSIARAVAPLVVYSGDLPLARMEWVDTDDWIGP